jgi:prevent-host-death family protein
MSTVNATNARKSFFDLVNRASHQERIAIERHGKPIAAIIAYEDLLKLEALEDAISTAQLKRAMANSEGFITIEELLEIRSIDG